MFYGEHQQKARPTKDIDFLVMNVGNDIESISAISQEILSTESGDALIFNVDEMSLEKIVEHAEYHGIRLKTEAFLEKAKIRVQIDFGFGDIIVPDPVSFSYPTLLDSDEFNINAYSWESVISEKFESIVKLSDINSRLKDFYDIYHLLDNKDFNGPILRTAVLETFNNRSTPIDQAKHIFDEKFYTSTDKEKQWLAFLRKISFVGEISFRDAVIDIKNFLEPIVSSIVLENDYTAYWIHKQKKWRSSN